MDLLFSFIQPDLPHSNLLAGYFSKVGGHAHSCCVFGAFGGVERRSVSRVSSRDLRYKCCVIAGRDMPFNSPDAGGDVVSRGKPHSMIG